MSLDTAKNKVYKMKSDCLFLKYSFLYCFMYFSHFWIKLNSTYIKSGQVFILVFSNQFVRKTPTLLNHYRLIINKNLENTTISEYYFSSYLIEEFPLLTEHGSFLAS